MLVLLIVLQAQSTVRHSLIVTCLCVVPIALYVTIYTLVARLTNANHLVNRRFNI